MRRLFVGCLVMIVGLSIPVFGQSTTGSILGDVSDTSGARLPGAAVRAVNEQTGAARETLTSELGSYRFNALQPGNYTVTVEFPGFKTISRKNIVVSLNAEKKLDFGLEIGAVSENIMVTEEAPIVQVTENSVTTIIDNRRIEELPLKTRNFMDLTLLTPGVVMDQAGAAVGTTDAISFYGLNERYKSIWLEGVDFNDEVTAGGTTQSSSTRTALGPEAIQEFQVMANSYSTEFGRSASGIVNVIVKSGGNDFHGNAYYFRRDGAYAKPNYFQQSVPPFRNKAYGGTLSGPLKKDRAHFFASYERRPLTQDITVTIPQALRNFVQSLNRGYDVATDVSNTRTEGNTVTKFNFTLNPKHTLTVTWLYDKRLYLNENFGGITTRDQGYDDNRSSYFGVATLTSLIGPNTVNEFRFNRSIQRLFRATPKGSSFLPALVFPSGTFGTGTGNPQARIQKNWIVSETMTHQMRQHNLKFGFEENQVWATADANVTFNGQFEFLQDRPVNPNDPSTLPHRFTQGLNLHGKDPTYASLIRPVGMHAYFVNDTWRFRKNLTFNYGIRYDLRTFKGDIGGREFPRDISEGEFWVKLVTGGYPGVYFRPVPNDKKDISPRAGFSWDPSGNGKTVIRGGYGLYYDRLNTSTLRSVVLSYPGLLTSQVGNDFRITGKPNSFFPNLPPAGSLPATGATSFDVPSRTAVTPRAQQAAIGIQRELARNYALTIDYVHVYAQHTERTRNVNARLPNGTFPLLPGGTALNLTEDTSNIAKIRMVTTRMEKRLSKKLAFMFGYTWGRAFGYADTPSNDYDQNSEYGPLNNDVRHRVTSNALYELPFGIHVSGSVTYNTAPPYNIVTGVTNSVNRTNGHPPGGGYNTGRGNRYFKTDIRTSKKIRIRERYNVELMVEMYNLFNTVNFNRYNGNMRSTQFGKPQSAFDPLQGQLAAKFTF